jgi:hypothetical protein
LRFAGLSNRGGGKDAGVVNENVQASKALLHLLEESIDFGDVRELGLQANGFAASPNDFRDDCLSFGLRIAIVYNGTSAIGGQAHRDGAADAAPCAGD